MKLIRIVMACAFIGQLLNAAEDNTTVATKQLFEAIEKKSFDGVKAAIAQGADVNKFMPISVYGETVNMTSLEHAFRKLSSWKPEEANIIRYLFENKANISSCVLVSNNFTLPCTIQEIVTPYLLDIFEREIPNISLKNLKVPLRSLLSLWLVLPIEYAQPEQQEFIQKIIAISLKLIEQGIGDLDPSNENAINFLYSVRNSPVLVKALLNRGTKAINEQALGVALPSTSDPESLQLLLDQTKNMPLSANAQSLVVADQLGSGHPELIEKVLKHGMRPSKEYLTDYIFNVFNYMNSIKTTAKFSEDDTKYLANIKAITQLLAQYIDPSIKYSKMNAGTGEIHEKSLNDILQDIAQKEKERA